MNINEIDETMSDEVAFSIDNNAKDEGITFDDVQEETPADSSPESEQEGIDSDLEENKQNYVSKEEEADEADEPEESRVPYSRFKSKVDELEERNSIISDLEERLSSLETARTESQSPEELEVPQEWVELYGDSDVSKRAYSIQLQREAVIIENATKNAIEQLKAENRNEANQLEENEDIIEDNLLSLQQHIGKKLTQDTEEAVLSIVDEFSPTGEDGKYISLFPFDKAYEIYELRNSQAKTNTKIARNKVADLTGNSSQGEAETPDSDFKRGWDNWREAL